MMKGVFLAVLLFVSVGIALISAGTWTKWRDLTKCEAKPCKCKGYENQKCEKGKKVQIRSCIYRGEHSTACIYNNKGIGALRIDRKCKNTDCPGWSAWQIGNCDCNSGEREKWRYCTNPAPIHPDVLCLSDLNNEPATEMMERKDCNCTDADLNMDEMTTEAIPFETTIEFTTKTLEWCCEQATDSPDLDYYNDVTIPQTTNTTTSEPRKTKKPSQLDLDYYDLYDEIIDSAAGSCDTTNSDCRPCSVVCGYKNATEVVDDNDNSNKFDWGR